ncbi:hypothetical protein GCK32_021435 [Trichostrongylus colubriformis]|uniref:C-type lectin domain-containing protein n=1 Tax=Trichostrongylus colubriformis TaxID=6319 RepID=A0AAN8IWE7_TRICO
MRKEPNRDQTTCYDFTEIATKAFVPEKRYVFWIGLRKCGSSWRWVDGKEATYFNWISPQPDNYRNNEDCVHLPSEYFPSELLISDVREDAWRVTKICGSSLE